MDRNVSYNRDGVLPHFQTYEKTAENTTRRGVFLTNFEVLGNVVN